MAVACCEADPDEILAVALARDIDRSFEHLVIAYRALQSYPAERRRSLRLRSWLYAIAHNLTRNAVRDAPPPSDPLEFEDGEARAALSDAGPGPEDLVLQAEAWDDVGAAIARLSPALRGAFVMRYVDELSYEEIAESLDQPIGTVKASAHRGLLAVRAQLEKNDE